MDSSVRVTLTKVSSDCEDLYESLKKLVMVGKQVLWGRTD